MSRENGRTRLLTDVTLENACYDPSGTRVLYQDVKGYEDPFRKHHTSAVTRDIWSFQPASGVFTRLTSYKGEDRNPVFASDPDAFFYLSEREGSFNVFQGSVAHPDQAAAVTHFKMHPVRFLTASRNATLCFSYDGEVWTRMPGAEPRKLAVTIQVDGRASMEKVLPVNGAITEMKVSPTGKELAFVVRGEIFVTSASGKVTRRITSQPGQERSVSFSPDGRTLLYAAERNGSWDVFTKRIVRKEEPSFFASTHLEEKAVAATPADDEALGRHVDKEALVVDTRFNGGGNIHEQLSDFLSGRKYFDVIPRGLPYGHEPLLKWVKPSIVLMSEGNYSDAHLFPVAYKLKSLGSTVGKPVPGTGTFVWWEPQIDPTLVFGIPQGGWRTPDGKFCENNQLEPDIDVANEPAIMSAGRDQQLEAAVAALLEQLDAKTHRK